jgi:hypothetical protein
MTPAPEDGKTGTVNLSLLRPVSLDQENTLDLVAIKMLRCAANANRDFGCIDRKKITVNHGAVTQLDGVVGGGAKLVTNTATGRVVGAYLEWKCAGVEAFLAELELVTAYREFSNLRCGAEFGSVDLDKGALGNGIDCQ